MAAENLEANKQLEIKDYYCSSAGESGSESEDMDVEESVTGPRHRRRSELADDAANPDMNTDETDPSADNDDDMCGSWGCTAHALWKLGVFNTQKEAVAALNAMGAELYGKRCKENGYDYKVELVYTAGDSWCSEVIKLAVVEAGYDFEKLKLDSDDLDLKATLKRGQYLIDGVQNRDWCMRLIKYTNAKEYTGPGPDQDPKAWRHSIGVQHGQVLEQNKHTFSAQWLWLQDDNRPDMTKGYMREILKVYRITKR